MFSFSDNDMFGRRSVCVNVGAGPISGLAVGTCLKGVVVPCVILERSDCIASLLPKKTYDPCLVKVVPGINKFSCGTGEVDSVVVATGYCSNVPYWLQESKFLSKNVYPKAQFPNKCRLYTVGFKKRRLAGASALIRKGQNSAHRIPI